MPYLSCTRCGEVKLSCEFTKAGYKANQSGKRQRDVRSDCIRNGRGAWCKPCKSAYDKERHQAGKHRKRPYEGKDGERAYRLRKSYGITMGEYNSMLESQGGVCKICGRYPKSRRLDIDHNHQTGEIRGLLCHMCNRGLAYISTQTKLRAAADYLDATLWGK